MTKPGKTGGAAHERRTENVVPARDAEIKRVYCKPKLTKLPLDQARVLVEQLNAKGEGGTLLVGCVRGNCDSF